MSNEQTTQAKPRSRKKKTTVAEVAEALKDFDDINVQGFEHGTPPKSEELNAVLVVKHRDPDGSISTSIATNGNVEVTEVQTLLELGLKGWREKIGLAS